MVVVSNGQACSGCHLVSVALAQTDTRPDSVREGQWYVRGDVCVCVRGDDRV